MIFLLLYQRHAYWKYMYVHLHSNSSVSHQIRIGNCQRTDFQLFLVAFLKLHCSISLKYVKVTETSMNILRSIFPSVMKSLNNLICYLWSEKTQVSSVFQWHFLIVKQWLELYIINLLRASIPVRSSKGIDIILDVYEGVQGGGLGGGGGQYR